jgi:hypothetical protein
MSGNDSGAAAGPTAAEYRVSKCPQYSSDGQLLGYQIKVGKFWELSDCEPVFTGTWDQCHDKAQELDGSGF